MDEIKTIGVRETDIIFAELLTHILRTAMDKGRPLPSNRLPTAKLNLTAEESIAFIRYAHRRLNAAFKQILDNVDVAIVCDIEGNPLDEGDADEGVRQEAS